MSNTIIGWVVQFSAKEGRGKKPPHRPYTLYSSKIELENGEVSDWIGYGFDDPGVADGDYVEIVYEVVNNRNSAQSVRKVKNAPARSVRKPAAQESQQTGAGSNEGGPATVNRRTNPEDAKRITYAAARTAAIEVITLLLENDALPVTGAKSKAAEALRFEEITAAIDKLTVQYFNDGISLRLLEIVADTERVKTKPNSDLPESDDDNDSGVSDD